MATEVTHSLALWIISCFDDLIHRGVVLNSHANTVCSQ